MKKKKDFIILYEDKDFIAVDKPAGVLVHPDTTGKESISDWMAEKYPKSLKVGEPAVLSSGETVLRPGIVHRLDRDTSGVLLIAKTKKGYDFLKEKFQNHEIEKVYKVFVYGEMKEPDGVVNRSIGKSASDFRKWSAQRGARGVLREATTKYKVLHSSKEFSFIEACPETGRTHQIRVHFKAINHPVVADHLYAPNHEPVLGFERLALHAHHISFDDPKGQKIQITADFPKDFKQAIKQGGIALE